MLLDRAAYEYWSLRHLGHQFWLARLRHRGDKTFVVELKGHGPVTIRTRSADLATFRQVFVERSYEPVSQEHRTALSDHATRIAERGHRPLILDLGANNGASSIWFATEFPEARIIAVEPDADNARVLRANTRHLDVEVVEAAIASQPGRVAIRGDADTDGHRTTWDDEGDIPATTVRDLISSQGPSFEPFIVKVDIEGFESDLFSSGTDWVDDACAVFIEPHDWMLPGAGTSSTFQQAMGGRDFDLLISGENLLYIRM